ncbi:MAG: hypothetical protein ACREF9_08450 [Opitutaceae bacterium]
MLLAALLALVPAVHGTSVIPPSFPELVAEADAIYRGRVTSVQARRVERVDGEGSVIKTFVTVAVERALKGPEEAQVTLEFLGGTVGDETMTVTGMPKFNVGAREIVFVQKNGVQFCPLVALMHGRYRVVRDETTAREHIARDNGAPLTNTSDVELPIATLPEPVRAASAASGSALALTPEAFESRIASEVQRPTPRPRTN